MKRCQLMKQSFILLFAAAIFNFASSEVLALQLFTPAPPDFCQTWRPVIAIGGGLAIPTNSSNSQTFPIVNSDTDQFFIYRSNNEQTAGFFDIFLGAEWAYLPELSLQMGIGYNKIYDFGVRGTFIQGADTHSQNQFSYRYNVSARQVLAEVKLLYNVQCPCYELYHPYIFVGLGTSSNNANGFQTDVPPFLTFTRVYAQNDARSFSYALGFGVDVDICRGIRIGGGYRFTDLGNVKLGRATIDSVPVSGTLSRSRFFTNEILAQLTVYPF